jgi:hypothetical protein
LEHAKFEPGRISAIFPLVLMSAEELAKAMSLKSWSRKARSISSVAIVSLPVFYAGGSRAVVYIGSYCGALCADGILYSLRRDDGKWSVVDRDLLWVS